MFMASNTQGLKMDKKKNTINDNFDFNNARTEWQVLSLWDSIPDCLKTRLVVDKVLQLVQSSPDLIIKMNLRGLNNG
jgi:hypothetical protein